MTRLVVTDMDGTLLDDLHALPTDIWDVIEELHEKDILFAVASGRQYQTLADIFDRVRDRMLFMAENGTFVIYKGEVISVNAIAKNTVKELVKTGRSIPGVNLILCGPDGAFVESTDEEFLSKARMFFNHFTVVDDLLSVESDIVKFTVCDLIDPYTNSAPFFGKFTDTCKITYGSDIWLDIMNIGGNKGSALKAMQEKLGISNSETIVFGDYMNDFEMMEFAENSYAMANAHPEILKVSNFVTELDNNQSGVVETLRKLGLVSASVKA